MAPLKITLTFGVLLAYSCTVRSTPLLKDKRTDELVLFGNQQNQGHLSVKKSGPHPPSSFRSSTSSDVERELEEAASHPNMHHKQHASPEQIEHALENLAKEENHRKEMKEERVIKDELLARHKKKPKRQQHGHQHSDAKHKKEAHKESHTSYANKPSMSEREALLKLKHQYEEKRSSIMYGLPEYDGPIYEKRAYDGEKPKKKSAHKRSTNKAKRSPLKRVRRDLVRRASESSMASSAVARKKRDVGDYDPETLRELEEYLEATNDGFYGPENTYAMKKRSDESVEDSEPFELEDEEEEPPLAYGEIVHEGIPGLFIPYDQPKALMVQEALEDGDVEDEKERLGLLASYLGGREKRDYDQYDNPYGYAVVERSLPQYYSGEGYDYYKKKRKK